MNNSDRSKSQLIEELGLARRKIARLEAARSKLELLQNALRESEERFRIALQNSNIVVYNQDADLRYTWVYNPQVGFKPEGIVGSTDAELLFPEDAAPLEEIKRGVLETGIGVRETVRTTIQGEAYYYDLTVEPLRDALGNIIGITGASRDITQRVRAEFERDATLVKLQERTHELGERVKELHCLYDLSRLRERPGVSLDEICQGTAELIPPAWQHPEITGACVLLDEQEFRTEGFMKDAPCQQSADIVVHGQVCGRVQVCYAEDQPACDEGPFLIEERSLLNAIAERLGRIIEHMRAEEASRLVRDELELRVQERTAELDRAHQRERVLNALLRLSMEDIPLDAQLERALDELLSIPWLPVQPRGAIFLVGDDASAGSGVLELRAQRGFDEASQAACKRVSFGQCLCGRAAAEQALIYAQPGDERHEIHHEDLMSHGHYCVPILAEEEIIGTIALYLEQEHRRDAQQEEFLQAVARTLAGIIQRKRVEVAVLEERGRLARDLHDSVTQSLYSMTLLAEGWKRLERAGRLDDSEDPLAELGEIAQQALKEMRLMVHELRPPDLEEEGLLGALRQRLGAVEKRAGVDARLVVDDVVDLSPEVEECLYRIALEALNNTLKHAGATSVVVRVRVDGDRVEMEVKDNGCGFDVGTLDNRRGMGLKGMQERAEQLGGAFLVDSAPSEGTKVRVSLSTRSALGFLRRHQ